MTEGGAPWTPHNQARPWPRANCLRLGYQKTRISCSTVRGLCPQGGTVTVATSLQWCSRPPRGLPRYCTVGRRTIARGSDTISLRLDESSLCSDCRKPWRDQSQLFWGFRLYLLGGCWASGLCGESNEHEDIRDPIVIKIFFRKK